MLQTLQNLALARLWSLGSARIRRSKTSHLPDCGLWALRDCGRSCAGCGLGALARRSSQPLDSGRFRRSKTSHLPDCGLWALRDCGRSCAGCGLGALARRSSQPLDSGRFRRSKTSRLWAELRRLWARGSGAPNPFFLVARNCPSNASNPSNPSNAPTLANGCAIRLDSGRFRRSMDASDAPKPRTC